MKPSTNQPPVNPGSLSPTGVPITSAGCCDACAEIANRYTFVVLPDNQSYSSVYFDVSYQTASGYATETVTVDHPPTNVIQVGLNPSRQYVPGMIWAIHHTR